MRLQVQICSAFCSVKAILVFFGDVSYLSIAIGHIDAVLFIHVLVINLFSLITFPIWETIFNMVCAQNQYMVDL